MTHMAEDIPLPYLRTAPCRLRHIFHLLRPHIKTGASSKKKPPNRAARLTEKCSYTLYSAFNTTTLDQKSQQGSLPAGTSPADISVVTMPICISSLP